MNTAKEESKCPQCNIELAKESVFCSNCGFGVKTKALSYYQEKLKTDLIKELKDELSLKDSEFVEYSC